ncbi:hypothetical protein [Alteromonas gilva]|uniref:Uncharacterized protein n=1 Tax=Alteromonas gilva TaxID=2987522 RepID=A0ABT5KYJ2_9ALTE|nr:hypothetical protein [Alteromonas gilva]MDC8829712.1 hypothetical protein [Alteromonas gilva]
MTSKDSKLIILDRKLESEIDSFINDILKSYEGKSFEPALNKVQDKAIKEWARAKNINYVYMWALIGEGEMLHRVKCKSVIKAGHRIILDAYAMCNSESWGFHRTDLSTYFLISDESESEKYRICSKCKK